MADRKIENRNIGAITEREQAVLRTKTVLIAGCGGLGGYCAELLSRLGIGCLVLCDSDVFEESNLNRQLFANERTLGVNKAVAASKYILSHSLTKVRTYPIRITRNNALALTDSCDLVMDALDNVETRYELQRACAQSGIPMITGGVSHWYGQVSTIYPGDETLDKIFGKSPTQKAPPVLGFTASTIASLETAEATKVLLGRPSLRKKLLIVDLLDFAMKILPLE